MDGKHEYSDAEYPSEEFRMWRLCTIMRCRPSELEEESAITLDWLIAIDDTVGKYRKEKEQDG